MEAKNELADSLRFAEQLVNTLRSAQECQVLAAESEKLRRENVSLTVATAELVARKAALEREIESKQNELAVAEAKYSQFATLEARAARLAELNEKVERRTADLKAANLAYSKVGERIGAL